MAPTGRYIKGRPGGGLVDVSPVCRVDARTGATVAIKVVNLEDEDGVNTEDLRREISVLSHCDSPYILRYYESFLVGTKLWIVTDYCALGSLRQIMVAPVPARMQRDWV